MSLIDIAFYFFAILIVGSAYIVVTSKNIMYSAFALLFTFFGVAGIYVLLNADFLAITQIVIYIGGILVLIIFGVMLTNRITGVDIKTGTMSKLQIWITAIICLIAAGGLIIIFLQTNWNTALAPAKVSTIEDIGRLLLTDYLIGFEIASVLLLIAIIGAALIARRKTN